MNKLDVQNRPVAVDSYALYKLNLFLATDAGNSSDAINMPPISLFLDCFPSFSSNLDKIDIRGRKVMTIRWPCWIRVVKMSVYPMFQIVLSLVRKTAGRCSMLFVDWRSRTTVVVGWAVVVVFVTFVIGFVVVVEITCCCFHSSL